MLLGAQQLILLKGEEEEDVFARVVNLIQTLKLVGPRLFWIGNGRHRVTVVLFVWRAPGVC